MIEKSDRKNLPLTRIAIERATQQERMLYGQLFAQMRESRQMSQIEVAEAAAVTTRTIRNIEQGKVAGQADKLANLFTAIGVDIDGTADEDVRTFTSMIAPVIRRIHPEYRHDAVVEVVGHLSDFVLRHPNVGDPTEDEAEPTELDRRREEKMRGEALRMVAKRGANDADVPHAE